MPSAEQLTALAEYLYGTTISSSGTTYATLDTEKASSLGFGSGSFFVWSSQEYSNKDRAYLRSFYSTYTSWSYRNRYDSANQAVCLGG